MLVDSMQKLHLHTWLYSPTDGQVSNPNLTWVISRLCTLYQDSHVPRLGDEVVLGYIAVQQQHMTTCHDFCNNCHSRWLADGRSQSAADAQLPGNAAFTTGAVQDDVLPIGHAASLRPTRSMSAPACSQVTQ